MNVVVIRAGSGGLVVARGRTREVPEALQEIGLAMRHKIPLQKLAGLIHLYLTYGLEILKGA